MNDTHVMFDHRHMDLKTVRQRCRTVLKAQTDALTAATDQRVAHMKRVGFILESV